MDEKEQQEEQQQEPVEEVVEEVVEQVEAPAEAKPQPKEELPKKLEEQPKGIAKPIAEKLSLLKTFWVECLRVLRVTRKPDKQEFTTIVKISAIGMAIIGVVGFLIHFAKELLF